MIPEEPSRIRRPLISTHTQLSIIAPIFLSVAVHREWFPRFRGDDPTAHNMPYHGCVGLKVPPQAGSLEYFVLEVMLYHDMAGLFNILEEMYLLEAEESSMARIKTIGALSRATCAMAFNFVEAYLNGIAADWLATAVRPGRSRQNGSNRRTEISDDEFALLFEYDIKKNRTKNVNFREKLMQYPKVILNTAHPLFTESNHRGVAVLCGTAKHLRDAIAHPSPSYQRGPSKLAALLWVDMTTVQQVVDAAVEVVRDVDRVIDGYLYRLGWIEPREAAGRFSERIFL